MLRIMVISLYYKKIEKQELSKIKQELKSMSSYGLYEIVLDIKE
jgi:hypothetical protein